MTDIRLTPEEFGRLTAVFGELRTAGTEERERVLVELAGGERAEWIASLRRMLAADDDESVSPLDRPVGSLGDASLVATHHWAVPPKIGAFEIEGELGEGAFGRVYLGRRREPFEQRAAVKVLHTHRHGDKVLAFFERETAALSRIEHPGVARILDAGLLESGHPYLITELVDGERLDVYCRARGLSIADRLRLVVQLCDAVQHAHQRSVVHRDLKPTNVLVCDRDAGPEVRVIDFGTAKLLEPTDHAGDTLSLMLVGTPGYLSPEQLTGSQVDARTDVFAIGVMLAELITGEPVGSWAPHAGGGLGSRVARLGDEAGPWRRNLEHIVRTATAVARADRYPTVAHLADDLRATLERRPLPGRSRSAAHLAASMLRRHPIVATVAMLLAAAVVVQSVRASVASYRLKRQVQTQRALVTGTLVDAVEQLGQLIGTRESRQALIENLLTRAATLERSGPEDQELGMAIARLIAARGDLAMEDGDLAGAEADRREVLRRLERLVPDPPQNAESARWHAEAVIKLGDVHKSREEWAQAERSYALAYEVQQAAAERFEDARVELLDDMCWSLERLVDWRDFDPTLPRTAELIGNRVELAESLVALDPSRTLSHHALATAQLQAWRLARGVYDYEASAEYAEAAVHHASIAAEAEPGRHAYQLSLLSSLRAAGLSQADLGHSQASGQRLDQALTVATELLGQNPEDRGLQTGMVETLAFRALAAATLFDRPGFERWGSEFQRAVAEFAGGGSLLPTASRFADSVERARLRLDSHTQPESGPDRP